MHVTVVAENKITTKVPRLLVRFVYIYMHLGNIQDEDDEALGSIIN
jgi:hypothetical protein